MLFFDWILTVRKNKTTIQTEVIGEAAPTVACLSAGVQVTLLRRYRVEDRQSPTEGGSSYSAGFTRCYTHEAALWASICQETLSAVAKQPSFTTALVSSLRVTRLGDVVR
ncbi:hypothetical protein G7B40_014755 [Aetokthonos hydrillicola Thurmond2011]|uniref:Uncharacterized protein n=1 Tax=Aetokthonos hydrillicola Thurmond2011 TaxID=2712845 RepID=A0AAP5IB35_9CYAN|nr:hypothetical protein [Aetokthonos hydrillicola]MBO3461391.1 hypothetical protein [Aetokthonos hydrillicola CCALA 1050]MBW4586827.1 hypothetical protein [Aetokthonos hydrillicola CCALA 1050]MDR9895815.1 hypothetical protein [Aetokthonos hydrillicola Thurmond2011]